MKTRTPQGSAIEHQPLAGICAGLLLTTLPLVPHVAPWALAMFGGALLMRLMVNRLNLGLPGLPLKIAVLALGLAGIVLSYGSMLGIEPGLGILLVLVSLKLLETNTVRDFQVLTLLGWFLSLCGLFFSQTLGRWLYVGAVCAVLTASLVRFHRGSAPGSFVRSARLTGTLLLQALPIILLLFVCFPRTYGGFRFTFNRSFNDVMGMADRLEPGSVSNLAMSDELAFTAEFPDGNIPSATQLYWRGGVLWRGNGLKWDKGTPVQVENAAARMQGPKIRQRIRLEPHAAKWLFALDRPVSEVPGTEYEPGGYLQTLNRVYSSMRYEVVSRPENRDTTLLAEHRRLALAVPAQVSPQVQALADSWRTAARDDRQIVQLALRFFREGDFSYTLAPGRLSGDTFEEFLFRKKTGFCEHYAGAFASLMRLAGVPSRVVIGYHGGEYNRHGNYIRVRQTESHAWAEVWLQNHGWERIDLTTVIAPGRLTFGLESFLEARDTGDGSDARDSSEGVMGLRDLLHELRLMWDSLNYQWDVRVLTFDEEKQRAFLAAFGFDVPALPQLLTWVAAGATLLIVPVWWLVAWGTRPRRDALVRDFERFSRVLAAAGLPPRQPSEGPLHFAERAARHFPARADAIRRIGDIYIAHRYAPNAARGGSLRAEMRALSRAGLS